MPHTPVTNLVHNPRMGGGKSPLPEKCTSLPSKANRMGYYFPDRKSLSATLGRRPVEEGVARTLDVIAQRYMRANPPLPLTYRAFCRQGILRGPDYRYRANFDDIFPKTPLEHFVYAWSRYHSPGPSELLFDVSCFGPLIVHLNGKNIYKSDIVAERYSDRRNRITLALRPGWNDLVIRFQKTRAGFGGIFGTWLGKHPYYFLMPDHPHRAGQEGWVFTSPLSHELTALPGSRMDAATAALFEHPASSWEPQQRKLGQFARLFGKAKAAIAVAWTTAHFPPTKDNRYTFRGQHHGGIAIHLNDREIYRSSTSGKINVTVEALAGLHQIMLTSASPTAPKNQKTSSWGFNLSLTHHGKPIPFQNPASAQGPPNPWLFIGPFKKSAQPDLPSLRDLHRVHPALQGDTYWRIDAPATWLRPYNDNSLYGHWNYPLGVTLYGLLEAGRVTNSPAIETYVAGHIRSSAATFPYALWDKQQYGGATTLHHLLSSIDSLDDCGSFGATLLEAARRFAVEGFRDIADYTAHYISNQQARLPDGGFFRKTLMHTFHENTLWADDLYMSVPFLARYAELTGDPRHLDDAANQFLSFKQRLYMHDLKLMSHVYDFRRNLATGIPWGRGNGWTLFSLSDLLARLPRNHRLRPSLITFFRDLSFGILRHQDSIGMWHQVLTHPDAYPETSCTAMFACAFARGVRHGWFQDAQPYQQAALKAWDALTKTSIDRAGNVHGVCRGSEFSFSPDYYKYDLLPRLNDTHGIGIVLLAGAEILQLLRTPPKPRKNGTFSRFPKTL